MFSDNANYYFDLKKQKKYQNKTFSLIIMKVVCQAKLFQPNLLSSTS